MAAHAAKQVATGYKRSAAAMASDPILASKVTAPGVPDWALTRPRITRRIAEGTRWCPLTVVTGPLGAGKTMALALWAATAPGPVAWVALDKYDNRPGVFWSYVVAALRRSRVALPKALNAATRGRAAEHPFLLRLAAALAAQDPPVTLVVDDFHLLTEPRVLSGLDFLLKNAGGLRLAVGSQAAPLLPLHRYRLAGELAEIGADDLAFTAAEAGQLLARHGCQLPAGSVEALRRHTEGWAAGLRLAAISLAAHPGPDRFAAELVAEDSALSGYLVTEVLDTQPREAREVLLKVSILEQVNAEIAAELTGDEQAGQILAALAHANAFVQPTGGGWYRFHTMFAEVLRRKLRLEFPDLAPALHRRAAEWHERNGHLTDAVRHAARAGDWPLSARMVIDGLAIGEIIEPRGGRSMAEEFAAMPAGETWAEPHPSLVSAAITLSAGRPESAATALEAAEKSFGRLPAGQQDAATLAAALIRLAVSRRTGDFTAAAEAAARAEALVSRIPGDMLPRCQGVRAQVLAARGTAELWSGRFDEAARVLEAGVGAAAAPGAERRRIDCLGLLALAEAWRGRLGRAAELACQAAAAGQDDGRRPPKQVPSSPAALAALAWVHLERYELREERSALKQLDTALGMTPDRLVGAVACLVAAWDSLAEGHAEAAAQFVARARSGRSGPAWLEQRLNLAESHALAASGDIEAALAAAKRADCDGSPEAAVTLARAWAAAGDGDNARAALAPVLAAREGAPDRVRLQACLVAAQVSYHDGDRARGRRSLGHALRLAEREQIRLPFAVERGWIAPALQRDPEWAGAHQNLVSLVIPYARRPARPDGPDKARIPAGEPLTERELQVLRHVSSMLTTAEIANELYISANTVKSHIKHICHKLAVSHRGEAVRRARQLQLI